MTDNTKKEEQKEQIGPKSIWYKNKYADELMQTAKLIGSRGKGILAADESTGTITKRLSSISVQSNEENRRKYRELLFTTKGLGEYISGVILYDETIRQKNKRWCSISTSINTSRNYSWNKS